MQRLMAHMKFARYSLFSLLIVICVGDVVVKAVNNEDNNDDICSFSKLKEQYDVNVVKFDNINNENKDGKCMELTFVDQGTQNKFQIYEKLFTVDDCIKILKKSKYVTMQLPKFVDLIIYCLSEENTKHTVNVNIKNGKYLEINVQYTPDQFTDFIFMLQVSAKEMNENDLIKLRLKELETNVPVLFYEKLTKSRNRAKGWNTINLDFCNDVNNKYIQHNKEKGSILLSPGKYIIEAEGTAHYVRKHIIQIINDDNTIKLNGTPQASERGQGWSTSTSKILKQVIEIKKQTMLTFRWWFEYTKADAALADGDYPYKDLGHVYVAAVVIQKV